MRHRIWIAGTLGLAAAFCGKGSPDLAFITPNGVVVREAGKADRILADTSGARGVEFAPDQTAVYVAGPHALQEISLQDGSRSVLTDGWEMIDSPRASHDGRRLAFAGYTREAGWSIYTLEGRNANPRFIAKGVAPEWMPDSRGLLFENYTDESAQIYRFDPETRSVDRYAYAPDGTLERAVSPALNASGSTIVFSSRGDLYLTNLLTKTTDRLTEGSRHYDSRPQLTHDGADVFFLRWSVDEHGRRSSPRLHRLHIATRSVEAIVDETVAGFALPGSSAEPAGVAPTRPHPGDLPTKPALFGR